MSDPFAFVESLESRRLLSASLSPRGVCYVDGTSKGDVITVNVRGSKVLVTVNGDTTAFAAGKVRRVVASGGGGGDNIDVSDGKAARAVPMNLVGGAGNDTLAGGSAGDEIVGGRGKDHLAGRGGDDTLTGGAGDDKEDGGAGDDDVSGGGGNDDVDGGDGAGD